MAETGCSVLELNSNNQGQDDLDLSDHEEVLVQEMQDFPIAPSIDMTINTDWNEKSLNLFGKEIERSLSILKITQTPKMSPIHKFERSNIL